MKKRLSLSLSLARSRKKKERGARSMCLSELCVLRSCEKFEDPHADESKIRLDISKKGRDASVYGCGENYLFFFLQNREKWVDYLHARTRTLLEISFSVLCASARVHTCVYIELYFNP